MTDFTRRSFLKQSTASMAAVAASGSVARALANGASNNIHFALIGAGSQGRHISGHFLKQPNVKMTAICEINPENAAAA